MSTSNTATKRLPFIDLMKGVCIVLIVTGHVDTGLFAALGENADRMFQTFRVPMYYFISGVFFKHYGGFFDFTRKKVNNILIPFAFFYALAYVVQMLVHFLPATWQVYGEFKRGYIVQPLLYRYWNCNVPLWFLLSLFQVNILYYLLQMVTSNRWLQVAVVMALAAGGYALCAHHIKPAYYTDTALVGMPFFVLGSLMKSISAQEPQRYDRWVGALFVPVLVAVYFLAGDIDIYSQVLPPYILLYVLSSVAIVTLFFFCKLISAVPGVNYLGRYSIVVLGTHYVYIPIVKALVSWLTGTGGLVLSLLTLVVVLALMFPTIAFFISVFPRFTAQKPFFGPGWTLHRATNSGK